MDPRMKMTSGFGLLSIDERIGSTLGKTKATIAMDPTGELTPAGSACEGDYEDYVGHPRKEGELTRTLSALQRLSVEERTTLQRKLREQQQQSSRETADSDRASKEDTLSIAPDSPYRVILQKAVVEGDLEAVTAALCSGADPNERDELRHSSLHFAAAKGDIGCLQELMNSGARANVANNVRPFCYRHFIHYLLVRFENQYKAQFAVVPKCLEKFFESSTYRGYCIETNTHTHTQA